MLLQGERERERRERERGGRKRDLKTDKGTTSMSTHKQFIAHSVLDPVVYYSSNGLE